MTYRLDQLVLPVALWALFGFIAWVMRDQNGFNAAAGFLGWALPLVSGVMAAYAVLDDPVLELQFATPRPDWLMLGERLGLILVVLGGAALSFQGLMALIGLDLSGMGGLAARQLAWLVPCIGLMALGSAAAFGLANSMAGALLVGGVWIVEVILRGWFLQNATARSFYLFLGAEKPESVDLLVNQGVLLGLALVLLLASWVMLRREERYI